MGRDVDREGVEPTQGRVYKRGVKPCKSKRQNKETMTRGANGRRRRYTRRVRRRRRGQKGGVLPALIPILAAGAKAIGLGALSGGASYGAKKALDAVTRRKPTRKAIKR